MPATLDDVLGALNELTEAVKSLESTVRETATDESYFSTIQDLVWKIEGHLSNP